MNPVELKKKRIATITIKTILFCSFAKKSTERKKNTIGRESTKSNCSNIRCSPYSTDKAGSIIIRARRKIAPKHRSKYCRSNGFSLLKKKKASRPMNIIMCMKEIECDVNAS
jgi:hypothetical protein